MHFRVRPEDVRTPKWLSLNCKNKTTYRFCLRYGHSPRTRFFFGVASSSLSLSGFMTSCRTLTQTEVNPAKYETGKRATFRPFFKSAFNIHSVDAPKQSEVTLHSLNHWTQGTNSGGLGVQAFKPAILDLNHKAATIMTLLSYFRVPEVVIVISVTYKYKLERNSVPQWDHMHKKTSKTNTIHSTDKQQFSKYNYTYIYYLVRGLCI